MVADMPVLSRDRLESGKKRDGFLAFFTREATAFIKKCLNGVSCQRPNVEKAADLFGVSREDARRWAGEVNLLGVIDRFYVRYQIPLYLKEEVYYGV